MSFYCVLSMDFINFNIAFISWNEAKDYNKMIDFIL